ncbi:MAG: long-chain fatty acid--CoA ligase [Acidobacteriota bacterium]
MGSHGATILNLASVIELHVDRRPTHTAIICGDTRLTYAQLNAAANRVANVLRARGVRPGDHVALSCPNVPHFPVAFFGILKVGAVVVPLNVLLRPQEIAYHLKDSDAVALLCFEGTAELPMARFARAAVDQVPSCRDLIVMMLKPDAPSSIERAESLGVLMAAQSDVCETAPTAPDDTAVILYTSGTTGQSKGAELTHLNMVVNAIASRDLVLPLIDASIDRQDVALITVPLFHSTGLTAQMNSQLYHGAAVLLLPRFDAGAAIDAMIREHVTSWIAVPTMYWALLRYAEQHQVDTAAIRQHLRACCSGGAPMPVETMREFEQVFGIRILEGYGLSETAPVLTFNHPDRPSKPGTVGQPLFGVQVRVVDLHDRVVPVGQSGEVVARGPNVMKGYYKRPEATAEAMRNGWFHTGDIGVFDADGYLAIVDRKKDMILRGGHNVYPRELEETLLTHPGVSMCAVIGVPDQRLGEEVKAFVVLATGSELTEAALVAWCKERMSPDKYPRYVEFRASLPTSATGKLLKRELRQL